MADERAFAVELARFFGPPPRDLEVGIGDDAAVVRHRGRRGVLCCDPVVAGVHFAADTDPALVGRKAVNRNLSDLAAMGAQVDWLLLSLVLPRGYAAAARRRLLGGVRAAARAAGARVVGGDVAVGPGPLVVTVTAVGHLDTAPLRRDRARAGDAVHLTGPVGGSRRGHHLRFRPQLAEGRWLARPGAPVGAAIDVSDGVLLDLATVLTASSGRGRRLGAELDAAAIPLRAAALAGHARSTDRLLDALREGEDHVLLFTVRRGRALPPGGPLTARARRPVGRVTDRPGLWLVERSGARRPLDASGYQHELTD